MASDEPKIEPAAGWRALAGILRQIYIALKDAGFTENESLIIIGHMLAANAKKNLP